MVWLFKFRDDQILVDFVRFLIRAGGISLAAPVLTGPVFSQGKNKISFLQKQVINKVLV